MNLLEKNLEKYQISNSITTRPDGIISEDTALQRYTRRFNQFIPPLERLNEVQKECLNEFGKAMEYYDKLLSPFRQQGIDYTIGLGGGAIRDFLLGNIDQIKDLDLFVCFEDEHYEIKPTPLVPNINKSIAKNILGEEFLPDVEFYQQIVNQERQFKDNYDRTHPEMADTWNKQQEKLIKIHEDWQKWRDNEFNKDVLTEVCMRLLDKTEIVTSYYSNKNNNKEIISSNLYLNDQMYGNIKLKNPNLKYPVDLVICKHPAFIFSASFDFSICKVVSNYSDNKYNYDSFEVIECFKPETPLWQNVYDNLLITPTFLKDLEDNTVSINIRNFTKEHVDYFMEKHFLNLKQKYPNRELKMFNTVKPDLKEYFDIVYLNARLNNDLLFKDQNTSIKRKI